MAMRETSQLHVEPQIKKYSDEWEINSKSVAFIDDPIKCYSFKDVVMKSYIKIHCGQKYPGARLIEIFKSLKSHKTTETMTQTKAMLQSWSINPVY